MARKSASQSPYHAGLMPSAAGLGASPNPAITPVPAGPDVAALPFQAPSAAPPVAKRGAGSAAREYARCDLCGEPLGRHAGRFAMVSPLTARHVTVCRTCRRAALGEGYRPRG
jgi:hypothetical protein